MNGPTSWRDEIKVHPAADLFPMMSQAELKELASDIWEHGLRSGVVFWTPESMANVRSRKLPEEMYLIDGRNRLAAIELAHQDDGEREEALRDAIYIGPSQEGSASLLYSEVDPYAYVVSVNIRRRHLNGEQKREIITELLKQKPERSDRATAKIAGVHHETVAATRQDLEGRGEIRHVETRTDSAGRQQPARKKAASTPAAQARDKAVAGFSVLLHQQLPKTLDDLAKLLNGEGDRIREIPKQKRIVLARAYLDALGVVPDDLGDGGEQ
jgi:hypothetical protein